VGLTNKSATAMGLTRLVMENHYAMKPSYLEVDLAGGVPGDLDSLLVIGDDALTLEYRGIYPHTLDLGSFWLDLTGLPFVFGLWAVNRAFADEHVIETAQVASALYASKNMGKRARDDAARLASRRTGVAEDVCRSYLAHIEYDFDADHRAGLMRFFQLLKERGEITQEVDLDLWRAPGREASLGA
jgi:chorismate dehydratase